MYKSEAFSNCSSVFSRYKCLLLKYYKSSLSHVSSYLVKHSNLFISEIRPEFHSGTSNFESHIPKKHWLVLCNAQSLFYRLDELRAYVSTVKPNYVCVTETWFTPVIDDSMIRIQGFLAFRNDRYDNHCDMRRGCGTIIYASVSVRPSLIEIPAHIEKPVGIESVFIKVFDPTISYVLCAYVPPGLTIDKIVRFRIFVTDMLDFVLRSTPEASVYVCGDFNRYDLSFLEQDFNLTNIVHLPTFRDATLDKVFCESHNAHHFDVKSSPSLGNAVNLHKVVIISKKSEHDKCEENNFLQKVYDFRKSNVNAFCKRMSEVDWTDFYQFTDVNNCTEYFYDKFSIAMSEIPVSFVKTTERTKPWITPLVIDLINKRWKAFHEKNFILYNHYKKKVKSEIHKCKIVWSNRMRSSSKGIWSIVKEIRGKNDVNSSQHILSCFPNADVAVEHVNTVFSEFFHCTDETTFDHCTISTNDINLCNPVTVLTELEKLRTDKSKGSDQIPPYLLKLSATDICEPVSFIYNMSFRSATVPDVWKLADVIPIPKSLPVRIDNLRPISLLPILSKGLEKLILKKYHEHLMATFDESQYAYRRKSSTVCFIGDS